MPVALQTLLSSTVVLALLAYAGLVLVLAIAVQPMRLHMIDLAEKMLAEQHWTQGQREEINTLLDTMDCLKTSIVLPFAVLIGTGMMALGINTTIPKDMQRLAKDERYQQLLSRYFLSLMAANPLATLFTIPLIVLAIPIFAMNEARASIGEALKEPVRQASSTVIAAYHARRLAA